MRSQVDCLGRMVARLFRHPSQTYVYFVCICARLLALARFLLLIVAGTVFSEI